MSDAVHKDAQPCPHKTITIDPIALKETLTISGQHCKADGIYCQQCGAKASLELQGKAGKEWLLCWAIVFDQAEKKTVGE